MTPAEAITRAAARCGVDRTDMRCAYGRHGMPPQVKRARNLAAHALVHHIGLTRTAAARDMGIRTGAVWKGVRVIERELVEGDAATHADVRHVCGLPPLPELRKPGKPERPHLPIVEPRTACPPLVRSCRHAWCRYNLGPDGSTTEMCALEVAQEDGPQTLEAIAVLFGGVSRERVRQLERVALAKYKASCEAHGIAPELMNERRETHWDRIGLHAPGRYDIALRGAPEDWRR